MRSGFSLVECMLAAAIFMVMMLVVFEGIIVSTKIAHENADLLAAEAVAWDAVWKRFNEDFDKLTLGTVTETLDKDKTAETAEQAPQLYVTNSPPVLTVTVGLVDAADFSGSPKTMKKITADLEWGPQNRRLRLSRPDPKGEEDPGRCPQAFRSCLGRAN